MGERRWTVSRFVSLVSAAALIVLAGLTTQTSRSRADGPAAADLPPHVALECPPCDDGNACTADSCDAVTGLCRFEVVSCDDGNPCTSDACDPSTGCGHAATTGSCDSDPNDCLTYECVEGACQATALPVGTACDDAQSCTVSDACGASGQCSGLPIPPGSACEDGNPCTVGDTCAATASGAVSCVPGVPKSCADSDPCTTDTCDPATGNCLFRPPNCDDGKACTTDYCLGGSCQHYVTDIPCNDGNACTIDDKTGCGPNNQLVCLPGYPRFCDIDHPPCYTVSCDPSRGCVIAPINCDDHNPCTLDSCYFGCFHTALSGPCDDGDACTTGDQCVVPPFSPTAVCRGISLCDDGNPCTDDLCDAAAPGGCRHVPNTRPCDDGNLCTLGDTCAAGLCVPGTPRTCDDHIDCTVDSCDPTAGCRVTPDNSRCPPPGECLTGRCIASYGCYADPAPNGTACTSVQGRCVVADCQYGQCVSSGVPVDCDDHDACTIDFCRYDTGCGHSSVDADYDGVPDCRDNCVSAPNPDQSDADLDAIGNACDNCPTIYNPAQGPDDCPQAVTDITVTHSSALGKGAGLVAWRSTGEYDLTGFNVLLLNRDGTYANLNPALIPCTQCSTGLAAAYSFIIPKHKSGRDLYIEMRRGGGAEARVFGPAVRQ